MKAFGYCLSFFRRRLSFGKGRPSLGKYRVTPRVNALTFRRALLIESIARLKRTPLIETLVIESQGNRTGSNGLAKGGSIIDERF